MTRDIQDWLNDHIDALLGDRSASPAASESTNEEQAHLMKAVRQLKLGASREEPHPDADFMARLESEMLQAMPGAKPKPERNPQPGVVWSPFWNLSWFRPVAGVAAAAAVLLLAVLLLRSVPTMSGTTALAPAAPSVMREQAKAPAAASEGPATFGATQDSASETKSVAPAGAAAVPSVSSRPLPDLVAQAQTILVGRVLAVDPALPSPGAPATPQNVTRVTVAVERYLKGRLSAQQATLLTGPSGPSAMPIAPGQRVLVMAGPANSNGDLTIFPDRQAAYILTPDGQAVAAGAPPTTAGVTSRLTESDLIAQIEAIVKNGQ